MSRSVAMFLFPQTMLSSVAAPTDLLQLANGFACLRTGNDTDTRTRLESAPLACRWLSTDGAAVTTCSGTRLNVDGGLDDSTIYDAVIVAAFDSQNDAALMRRIEDAPELAPWLRRQHRAGAVLAACGSGVFALAETGLLDRRTATAPWWQQRLFHRRYPAVRLDVTQRITESDRLICAGSFAGLLPMALRVVQRIVSVNAADWLAKTTLIDTAAEVETPQPRSPRQRETHDALVAAVQYQMLQRYAEKGLIGLLADQHAVSTRTLVRRFQRALGMSPQAYLQSLRIEAAQQMLRRTPLAVDRIGQQVGYGDSGFFKRVFRAHTGVTPGAWRAGFGGAAPDAR